ncbi:MAG: hypothetical protein IJW67_02565 [Blautia sp.]|nr:hypothetical protein [Blautia sp.]
MTYHGNNPEIIREGGISLLREMRERGITPAGPLCTIGIVGPYCGEPLSPDDYVFRFAIPV